MTDKQTVKFGDICREVKLNTKDPIADGYERYIGLEHLDSGSLKIKRWGMIAEDNPSFTRVFKKGHVLFGKRRPYLKKAAIAEFDGVCSGDIIVMDGDSKHELSRLLSFIVQSEGFWNWAIKTSSGSLSPRTKFKDLSQYVLKIDGSTSISDMYSALKCGDDTFHKTASVSDECSVLFGTIITNIMSRGLFPTYKQMQTKYLKHNANWDVKPLSEIITKVKRGPSLSTNERGKGVRYFTSGNIQNNAVDMSVEVKYLDGYDAKEQCLILPRDILFNCVNSMAQVGKVAYVAENTFTDDVIVGFNNYALEVDDSIVLPKFLYYFMRDKRFLHRVKALVKPAINQASFASKELDHMLIAFPSTQEQEKIISLLDEVDELQNTIEHQIKLVAGVKKSYSNKLGL